MHVFMHIIIIIIAIVIISCANIVSTHAEGLISIIICVHVLIQLIAKCVYIHMSIACML